MIAAPRVASCSRQSATTAAYPSLLGPVDRVAREVDQTEHRVVGSAHGSAHGSDLESTAGQSISTVAATSGWRSNQLRGERALGHERQVVTERGVDRGAYEPAPDAVPLERVGHLGVDEDEPPADPAVHELGEMAVDRDLEPARVAVVDDLGGVGRLVHRGQDRTHGHRGPPRPRR